MDTNADATPESDLELVCRLLAEGKRITDSDLLKRLHRRAEQATQEVFERHGFLNIAVDLIREARDEE